MNGRPASTYAAVVGERLRAVRLQHHLSLKAVASASAQEFRASALGAYERGERTISVPRLERLARLYHVPVEQLLPRELSRRGHDPWGDERSAGGSKMGAVAIDLRALANAPGEHAVALRRFVTAIQVQRHSAGGETLTVRADDLRVIGASFGLVADELLRLLAALGVFRHYGPETISSTVL